MKNEIILTLTLTLDQDRIQEALDNGYTYSDIQEDIRKEKLSSVYVMDFEVADVEAIV